MGGDEHWSTRRLGVLAAMGLSVGGAVYCSSSQSNSLPLVIPASSDGGGGGGMDVGQPVPGMEAGPLPDAHTPVTVDSGPVYVFAVIGNYGVCGAGAAGPPDAPYVGTCPEEQAVAAVVHSWGPTAVFTTGDNSYGPGDGTEIPGDQAPYGDYIEAGTFFPAMGNVDWSNALNQELAFFKTVPYPPYYEKDFGDILSAYVLDTNPSDPGGDDGGSLQATWLSSHVASSQAAWKLVFGHYPPYSSCAGSYNGQNGMSDYTWLAVPGVSAVVSGHLHAYESLSQPNAADASIPFLVMGASGVALADNCDASIPGSMKQVYGQFGAMKLTLTQSSLEAGFFDATGNQLDSVKLAR